MHLKTVEAKNPSRDCWALFGTGGANSATATSLGLTTTRSSGRFSVWRKGEMEGGGELVRVSARNKPYCELGKLLDALARSRDVRGSYNIF
jgi:hypothetical protein